MKINFSGDVKHHMSRLIIASLLLFLFFVPLPANSQEVSAPEVRLNNNEISITFSLNLGAKHIKEVKDGIDKELKLYIDLFKVWKVWPDEFVLGKVITRTLKSDPIKGEYVATSLSGNVLVERRFRSFESMVSWTLSVRDLKLASTRELEPGQYFVRVTAESKIRKLPPVIGHFIIFVSENEFKIKKDSAIFAIEGNK
jgi:hypothetical protein